MWRWLNMRKEDKMSQLTLERQQFSLRCLCCHSCKNRNTLGELITLIKVVLLFVWMFPERNTDFPHCFIFGQKLEALQGPTLYNTRTYVLGFLKCNRTLMYFKCAITESNISLLQIDSLETSMDETQVFFLKHPWFEPYTQTPTLETALCLKFTSSFKKGNGIIYFPVSSFYVGHPDFRTLACIFT